MNDTCVNRMHALIECINIKDIIEKYMSDSIIDYSEVYYREYDIIVPIYNGYDYLFNLFSSLKKTKVKYRLILVDDFSPDEKVKTFLKDYVYQNKNAILINHEKNEGFVQSVNDGLKIAKNDVVILNTDVEVPEFWLERLVLPVVKDGEVASATPFTNSGTICSFPKFLKDNKLFGNADVGCIDNEFLKVKPQYITAPTGVGFCMAMSKYAIDRVGFLDHETFFKGYGEENDWCQRAIKEGFKNVIVENLFVFHNHGGSFESEEKKRLIENNLKLLNVKHPLYKHDVATYCKRNPHKDLRELLICLLGAKLNYSWLVLKQVEVDDLVGYIDDFVFEKVQNEDSVTIFWYDLKKEFFRIEYYYLDFEIKYDCDSIEHFLEFLNFMKFDEIAVCSDVSEELVSTIFGIQTNVSVKKYKVNNIIRKPKIRPLLGGTQLRKIVKADSVVVYGAGEIAGRVIKCLERFKIAIACLAVTNSNKNPKEVYGIAVKEITELKERKENTVIVIAVAEKSVKEILTYVKMLGFTHVVTLNY